MKKYLFPTIREFAIPIVVLMVISIISLVLFVLQPFNGDWQGSIFSNIATEVLGIIITIVFLDLYITIREQKEKNERQCSFLKTLRQPINRHLSTLFNIYKATRLTEGVVGKFTVSDFFNEEYYNHIILLDLGKPAPVFPEIKWYNYLARETKKYFDELDRFLDKYSFEMELECIQYIEAIKSNSWLNLQIHLDNPAFNFGNKLAIFYPKNTPGDQTEFIMREYHKLLVNFISYVNSKFDEEYKIIMNVTWPKNVSPTLGSGRLEEPF